MKSLNILLLAVVMLTSCHKAIWDKLNDHEERIARLEVICNQLNTNISSLQAVVAVLNARDYVKDVVPVTENGKVIGYTITFNASNPITIYNGIDGKDGHTPAIGIRQGADGIWYWTLDGEWILGADNNKVRADGLAPKLKIEDDYWWVSYDNGTSWSVLGKAEGGQWTEAGSIIIDIRQDERYVYIVLASGEEIAIAKGGLHWVYV